MLAYQVFGYVHQGYWPTMDVGSIWDRLGERRPWLETRELQTLLAWLLDLPLSTACFGLCGFWLLWGTAFRHLFNWTD